MKYPFNYSIKAWVINKYHIYYFIYLPLKTLLQNIHEMVERKIYPKYRFLSKEVSK